MFKSSHRNGLREHVTIVIPAAGVLFCCAAQLRMLENYCAGDGCSIYQGFNLFGIPFYVLGIGLFLTLLCSRAFVRRQELYVRLSLLAIILDAPLLIWQTVFSPCSNCLAVAALLLSNAYFALGATRMRHWMSVFIASLMVLVLVNVVGIVRQEIQPWTFTHGSSSAGRMFFSPSCGPCRVHIWEMTANSDSAAFQLIPISLSAEDDYLIHAMARAIDRGLSPAQALRAAQTGPRESIPLGEVLLLQLRLHWNRAVFDLMNGPGLPFFTFHGTKKEALVQSAVPAAGLCIPSAKSGCE